FPKLTEVGAKRVEADGSIYSGFLTQQEIKEIVSYAAGKMIMVVPEIDLPGHTQAMISSYPHLSCLEEENKVWNEWGVSNQILCASKKEVYVFLEKLLEEIIPLFPAPYFHIGGDECPTTQWENCPTCIKLMEEKGYRSYRDLQAEVTNFLSTLLKKHNKILIGWDEIAEFSCPTGAVLMCWRGDGKQAVANANKQNLDYILTPNHPMYLDWRQSSGPDEYGGFGITTLGDVYNFNYYDLISDSLLGMQANIWTERIETFTKLEYMAYPRIIALAENCWTTLENKNYNRFLIYLKRYLSYYDKLLLNYCTSNLDNNNKFEKQELITRDDISSDLLELNDVTSVFNPGAIKIENTFYLLLRVQNRGRETFLVKAESNDGKEFDISDEPVKIVGLESIKKEIYHIYDPRLTYLNDQIYVMTAIDTSAGCFLGLFITEDLETLTFQGFVSEPDVRNGVIFPEQVNGEYVRLERPNLNTLANGTKTGSAIYLSTSKDLIKWSEPKFVMSGNPHYWDELIGSGPAPIKTKYGWLHIYHGVATHFASSNIYQAGFTFLDLQDPTKVLFRSKYNILEPRETFECVGQVPNVVFPTGLIATLYDHEGYVKDDSALLIYYGAADTSVGLVETSLRFFIEKMLTEQDV
ncbi:MAG: family 20 glycosylhydrolase, partial [Candidatus Cloacimonadales bacterium]